MPPFISIEAVFWNERSIQVGTMPAHPVELWAVFFSVFPGKDDKKHTPYKNCPNILHSMTRI